jgi:hypothetical protein
MNIEQLEKTVPDPSVPQLRELPKIIDATEFVTSDLPLPRLLIEGVLHQGSKLILGGGSKTQKTWSLLDMAASVATGNPWQGFPTIQSKVLYINLEVQPPFFRQRLNSIVTAKGLTIEPGQLEIWNLRGHAADYQTILPRIHERIGNGGYGLLILDPIYKLLGNADENSASDIGAMMNRIEELAVSTKAACAMSAHFSKGNQAGKETIDRISGSGVFARDPDSLIFFTAHKEEGCFTVEMVLRNLPPVKKFVARWQHPLFVPDDSLNPDELKQAKFGKAAAPADIIPTPEQYLALFPVTWDEGKPRNALRTDGEIREVFKQKKWSRNAIVTSREAAIRVGTVSTYQKGRNTPLLIGRTAAIEAFKAQAEQPIQAELAPVATTPKKKNKKKRPARG